MFGTGHQYGNHFVARKNYATVEILVCEQALQVLWRRGKKRKESLQLRLWNLNPSSNSLVATRRLCVSDFRQSARSENECECKQTLKNVLRVMTSLLMSSPPISISHRLFLCRYSNSRDVVSSSTSFSRPAPRAPWRACSQSMESHLN